MFILNVELREKHLYKNTTNCLGSKKLNCLVDSKIVRFFMMLSGVTGTFH